MFKRVASAVSFAAMLFAWTAAGPVSAAGDDPVVATVNGVEIPLSQVKQAHERLPEQYQRAPFEAIFPGLVDSLIDSRLAAEDARRQNLHDTPQFKDQIARIEEQVLQRMALSKVIADKASGRVLGAQILSAHASELIAEAVLLMELGGSAEALARTIHAHPTMSEGLREAAHAATGESLHI